MSRITCNMHTVSDWLLSLCGYLLKLQDVRLQQQSYHAVIKMNLWHLALSFSFLPEKYQYHRKVGVGKFSCSKKEILCFCVFNPYGVLLPRICLYLFNLKMVELLYNKMFEFGGQIQLSLTSLSVALIRCKPTGLHHHF